MFYPIFSISYFYCFHWVPPPCQSSFCTIFCIIFSISYFYCFHWVPPPQCQSSFCTIFCIFSQTHHVHQIVFELFFIFGCHRVCSPQHSTIANTNTTHTISHYFINFGRSMFSLNPHLHKKTMYSPPPLEVMSHMVRNLSAICCSFHRHTLSLSLNCLQHTPKHFPPR